jgi:hypothetical protein
MSEGASTHLRLPPPATPRLRTTRCAGDNVFTTLKRRVHFMSSSCDTPYVWHSQRAAHRAKNPVGRARARERVLAKMPGHCRSRML